MSRPLLYLDVDGPLNPYAAKPERRPEGYTTHRVRPESWIAQHPGKPRVYIKPLRIWLNPSHGRQLLQLAEVYDLIWATTWGDEANTFISPVLGLPELPVVDWPTMHDAGPDGTFWKTRHLVAHAALPTARAFASMPRCADASRACAGWGPSFSLAGRFSLFRTRF
ncbi:hypothetical protein STBA_38930 [Streptomyces sp. MP131-18]|nr:hypothetical protein STBA_38930 [Streptomyces sp. MP131-18]